MSNTTFRSSSILLCVYILSSPWPRLCAQETEDEAAGRQLREFIQERRTEWLRSDWTGTLGDGNEITAVRLQEEIDGHKQWLATNGQGGSKADLTGATLCGAYLDYANLCWSDCNSVNFADSNMYTTFFIRASLRNCSFANALLDQSDMTGADLQGSDFRRAQLEGVKFNEASLVGADFRRANLREADFTDTDISQSRFERALGLVELRDAMREAGFEKNAKTLTYMIRKTRRMEKWSGGFGERLDSAFNLLFFEIPCKYGLSPFRPLVVLALLIPVFAVVYMLSLRRPGPDGIWIRWDKRRLRKDIGSNTPKRLRLRGHRAALVALYFSVLSAFNIGWREFSIGTWFKRLQRRDYALEATGWIRTVSGLQSLLGLYLFILCLTSYFGHLFQ